MVGEASFAHGTDHLHEIFQRIPAVPEGGYLNSGAERESIERENLNNGG